MRHFFGQSPADWTFTAGDDNAALLAGGIALTFWDTQTSGTQYVDLLDSTGMAVASVTSSDGSSGLPVGTIPLFYGPEGVTQLWADAGGGYRSLICAQDGYAPVDDQRFGKIAGMAVTGTPAVGRVLRTADSTTLTYTNNGTTDWINGATYGATGDGETDDTAAIQAAIDACPPGGTVYLPAGVYRTSTPLLVAPYTTLRGAHGGGEAQDMASPRPSAIRPLDGFSGAAVVQILDQQGGEYDTIASEIAIHHITIDGSDLSSGTTAGIQLVGQIQHVSIRDVQVRQVPGTGIDTEYNLSAPPGPQAPFCLHLERVSVLWAGSHGLALNNTTDSVFSDVYVLGCTGYGWYISGASGSTWVACRAEWSGLDGFTLPGNHGVQTFIGCSTDRNANSGFVIGPSSDDGQVMLVGCRMTRDGRSSTSAGLAGLRVTEDSRSVIVSGAVIATGADDDGSGTVGPQYGVSVDGSAHVAVDASVVNGATAGWRDGGSNTALLRGPLVTGTGITSWTWPGIATTTAAGSTSLVLQASVSGDTQPRFTVDASGLAHYGPGGSTAPDAGGWYRVGAGAIKSDSYVTFGSGQADSSFTSFATSAKALVAGNVGGGLAVAEGTNGRSGTATLVGGVATVANTSVTANTRIHLTAQSPGGTPGALYVNARTAGTSFQVKSSSAADTSTVAWLLVEPA